MRLLASVVLIWILSTAGAQGFRWTQIVQTATIQPNGDVHVEDVRTLSTDGDFGEAFICISLEPGQSVTLLEGSGAVSQGPPATALTQPCDVGTEILLRNSERVTERRMRFVYILSSTVDFFSDVVQWYWNLEPLDHPPIDGYRLMVRAPGPMAAPYDAYVHRYSNPERPLVRLFQDRSTLVVEFRHIPPGDGVEIRYLMDPALFTVKGTEKGLDALIADELELVRRSQP